MFRAKALRLETILVSGSERTFTFRLSLNTLPTMTTLVQNIRLAQSKIGLVALNDTESSLIDLDVAFYMYKIQSFNSAHVKCGV